MLVLGLVNLMLMIEEFYFKFQEVINFFLWLFVIFFLKVNLFLLQWEFLYCVCLVKQMFVQYLVQYEQFFLDVSVFFFIDFLELLLEVNENGKRRMFDRIKENGLDCDLLYFEYFSKWLCILNFVQCYSFSNGFLQFMLLYYCLEDIVMVYYF